MKNNLLHRISQIFLGEEYTNHLFNNIDEDTKVSYILVLSISFTVVFICLSMIVVPYKFLYENTFDFIYPAVGAFIFSFSIVISIGIVRLYRKFF